MRTISCDRCKTDNKAIAISGMEMQTLWGSVNYRFFNCGPQKSDVEILDLCPECMSEVINFIRGNKNELA